MPAPALAAGTLLVKDGSHDAHERFFQTACVLPPEERAQVKDWCALFKPYPILVSSCRRHTS